MNAVVFAFTARGRETARRARDALSNLGYAVEIRVPRRLAGEDCLALEGGLAAFTGTVFARDALLFVGAAGIAVRAVAPHVADKRSDPAVLCADEAGRWVIPLLSGHIGGANRLAERLAAALGAEPVVTTATDVNGRFSVDAWAAERGMRISDMELAKRVSAAILERDVPFFSDAAAPDVKLPEGLYWADSGELGICVSVRELKPFGDTLRIAPRALCVGIGCRRGASAETVDALVRRVFQAHGLNMDAVARAASIDLKSDEAGLLDCCRRRGWPVSFYTAEALARVPGAFSASDFVRETVGVDNVCERAAAASGGKIVVPKTAMDGVTVAVAELEWGVEFGQDSCGGHRAR